GERIVNMSSELDSVARNNVDDVIHLSQAGIVIFLPMFFIIGSGVTFIISAGLANRIGVLAKLVESTGYGIFNSKYILPTRWNNAGENLF
ncbi:MAG: hypothetical protein L3V56_11850, partial [Candidatus Magnetoovum sp. WYHC-5]|nr:hypothetical protein [Candidatus Magnetoovum sp. WYHC-5]